ncbi:MAG: GNAT family N-acetyltransferase, partial [Acidimicrobiia bacterium]
MFRRARAEERALLDAMTLAGIRHWGHHENHPAAYAGLEASLNEESGPENHPVYVLEEREEILGFFELRDRGDHIELLRMFLRPDLIGKGYGRRLWLEAAETAGATHRRMLIMSDPRAVGFYREMGADYEGSVEVSPGFELG